VDVVFNLAAKITLRSRDDEAWAVNAGGTATVARSALAAGVDRVVHCSSVQAFDIDRCGSRLDEDSPRAGPGRPVYDRSKAAGEDALRALAADGLDAVIVNPTGIVGPVDLGTSRSNSLLGVAARGRLPLVIAGGSDFVDVRDIVDAMIAAVELGRTGENYVLSGHRASLRHIARMAAGLNGRLGPLLALPAGLCRRLAPLGERVGAVVGSDVFTPAAIESALSTVEYDHAKATHELRYVPRPLEETVLDLLEWMRADGQLDPRMANL
jgi:dihydroflavonol-4-reductase